MSKPRERHRRSRRLRKPLPGAEESEVRMFGWFAPKCPLGTWEKTWTETRMRWLADTLGIDRLRQARLVLPNEEFFPDPYDASPEGVRRLMERVAGYMGLDPGPIGLDVCSDEQL